MPADFHFIFIYLSLAWSTPPHYPPHLQPTSPFIAFLLWFLPVKKQKQQKGKAGRHNNRQHHQKLLRAEHQKAWRAENRPTTAKMRGWPSDRRCHAARLEPILQSAVSSNFCFFNRQHVMFSKKVSYWQQEASSTNRKFRVKSAFLITISSVGNLTLEMWLQLQVILLWN